MNRFEPDWLSSGVLILEMRDRLLVGGRRMQLDGGLFPFQFRAGIRGE